MDGINDKMDKLMRKMDDLEKSLGKKYEEIKANIKITIENQEILNQSLKKLQKENKLYKDEIADLKERVEGIERNNLETTMNLYPVIETENLNLADLLQKISRKTGIKIDDRDVVDKYRKTTKRSGKPGDIIIKFKTKEQRDKLLLGIKKAKLTHEDIGITGVTGRIYGNEELTKQGKDIYYKALKMKYEQKWKFLWVRGGRTYVRLEEKSRAIRLDNMEILEKLCKTE